MPDTIQTSHRITSQWKGFISQVKTNAFIKVYGESFRLRKQYTHQLTWNKDTFWVDYEGWMIASEPLYEGTKPQSRTLAKILVPSFKTTPAIFLWSETLRIAVITVCVSWGLLVKNASFKTTERFFYGHHTFSNPQNVTFFC